MCRWGSNLKNYSWLINYSWQWEGLQGNEIFNSLVDTLRVWRNTVGVGIRMEELVGGEWQVLLSD